MKILLLFNIFHFHVKFSQSDLVNNSPLEICEASMPDAKTYGLPDTPATLLQVHVFTRHGDRAPLKVSKVPNIEEQVEWNCENPMESHSTQLMNGINPTFTATKLETHSSTHFENKNSGPPMWKGTCEVGQLTPKGAIQHQKLGKSLRTIYVEQLKFLPSYLDNSLIVARSTSASRTKESAMNLLSQLYPPQFRDHTQMPQEQGGPITIPLNVYPDKYENLHHVSQLCPQIKQLEEKAAKSEMLISKSKEMDSIKSKMVSLYGDQSMSLHSFFTTVGCRKCNDKVMPQLNEISVTDQDLLKLQEYVNFEMGASLVGGAEALKATQLKTHSLMKEVMEKLTHPGKERFFLYSAHDTTISVLLGVFDAAQNEMKWPPYASNFIIELWQDETGLFLRVIYNGHFLQLANNWCPMAHCRFEDFQNHFQPTLNLDMKKECELTKEIISETKLSKKSPKQRDTTTE